MRVATWNINGLRARLDFLTHWLEAREPDLVGLQELKVRDEGFPRRELEALGYHAVCHGQHKWNGVAILSRGPLEVVESGLPGQQAAGARLLTARSEGIDFCTVYCPNGKSVSHPDFEAKLAWFDSLAEHLEESHDPSRALIIGGDFNVVPSAADSWNEEALSGHIFHTERERARLQRLLDWGLVDLYRALSPEERMFSWWDYRAGAFHKNHGLRIDLLLGTQAVAKRASSVWIDRDYRKKKDGMTASDHAPVIADLD